MKIDLSYEPLCVESDSIVEALQPPHQAIHKGLTLALVEVSLAQFTIEFMSQVELAGFSG